MIRVAAAIIREAGRILLVQRPTTAAMGGLWEFPGGKLEPGETPEAALARELVEELDITVQVGPLYHTTDHTYPDGLHVQLAFYSCTIVAGHPRLLWGQALASVAPAELPGYAYPPADVAVVQRLADEG